MNTDTSATIVATTVFFENKVNVFYIGPKIIYFFDGRSPTKPNVLVCGLIFFNQTLCKSSSMPNISTVIYWCQLSSLLKNTPIRLTSHSYTAGFALWKK